MFKPARVTGKFFGKFYQFALAAKLWWQYACCSSPATLKLIAASAFHSPPLSWTFQWKNFFFIYHEFFNENFSFYFFYERTLKFHSFSIVCLASNIFIVLKFKLNSEIWKHLFKNCTIFFIQSRASKWQQTIQPIGNLEFTWKFFRMFYKFCSQNMGIEVFCNLI